MTRIRRLAVVLTGLTGAVLAFAAAAPTALAATAAARAQPSWADPPLPPGWHHHPLPPGHVVHAAAVGGMPGWQIALLAAATALAAPTIAVLWDRARPARRDPVTGAAAALHAPNSPGQPPGRPLQGRNHANQRSRQWTAG